MDTPFEVWREGDVLLYVDIRRVASDFIDVARRVAATLGIDHSPLSNLDTIKLVKVRLDEIGLEFAKELCDTSAQSWPTVRPPVLDPVIDAELYTGCRSKREVFYKSFVRRKEVQATPQDRQAVQQPETEMEL